MESRIRKPQTAAGFVPKARETQARKTLETLPTEPILKRKKKMPPARKTWPWKTASGSLKLQQDSCPKHAKRKPEKLSKRCLRNPLKRKKKMPPARKTLAPSTLLWNRYESNSKSGPGTLLFLWNRCESNSKSGLGKPHPKASNSSRIRAQSTRNASPKNSRNVAYGTHYKKKEKNASSKENLALENRIRKPQTAAGFVPKARETQARKTLETLPTEPAKKKEKNASSKENLGAKYAPLESLRKQLEIWPWQERSSSSGIGAKATRNLALESRIRKPQTAAGFVPKARETRWCRRAQFCPRMPQMWPADSINEGKWQNTKHAQDARGKPMYQSKLGQQMIRGPRRSEPPRKETVGATKPW